jgi:hypothetical protein
LEDCARNFPDDPAVADSSGLLRRIPPKHFYFDKNLGRWRPSSAAFEDDDDGDPMSVYRWDVIDSEGGNFRRVMTGHKGFGLAALTAGQFRSKHQTVCPEPLPEESSHTKICGPKPRPTRRWFSEQAVWVIPPPARESFPLIL